MLGIGLTRRFQFPISEQPASISYDAIVCMRDLQIAAADHSELTPRTSGRPGRNVLPVPSDAPLDTLRSASIAGRTE